MTRESELLIDMWDILHRECHKVVTEENYDVIKKAIKALEQEQQTFKWCTDCKEYDQEKHCCHRWSKVIRDTVEEMKQEPILDKIRAEIETKYGQYDICEYFEDYDYEEKRYFRVQTDREYSRYIADYRQVQGRK